MTLFVLSSSAAFFGMRWPFFQMNLLTVFRLGCDLLWRLNGKLTQVEDLEFADTLNDDCDRLKFWQMLRAPAEGARDLTSRRQPRQTFMFHKWIITRVET